MDEVYTLEIESTYTGHSSMIFTNINTAHYWTNQYYLAGTCHGTLRKLCKRHAKMHRSDKSGKCCRVLFTF
jgi:hypothetical protein